MTNPDTAKNLPVNGSEPLIMSPTYPRHLYGQFRGIVLVFTGPARWR